MASEHPAAKSGPEKSLARRTELKFGLVEKITSLLGGIFLTPLLVSIVLKFSPSFWGGVIGTIIATLLAVFTFKKYPDQPAQRTIALGMLISVFLITIGTLLVWIIIQSAYRGISG